MTGQNVKSTPNSKKWAMEYLLQFIEKCPQIIQPGIGAEEFVEELNNASIKFAEYFYKQD